MLSYAPAHDACPLVPLERAPDFRKAISNAPGMTRRSGRRASCATASFLCCPTAAFPLKRSRG